jgi:alkanesulfonate monooxygenase SsuD/methylene tetrahydromethanopterin reductase-like flavin-dependent oxidoreductase (luciferase family)
MEEQMTKPVTLGLIYTFGNPDRWAEPTNKRYAAILEQIEWIDRDLDLDGIYVTEHHFYDDGYIPSTMTMLGAIAARTSRVTIGTNLIQLPLHNPVRLAEDALVVDALSGGRLRMGFGMGYYHQEFNGMGVNLKERPSRTEEGIEILRLAFAGEPFSYHGRRYDFDEITVTPKPIRPGGPEIWMGGFAPKAIERAARMADGFLEFDLGTSSAFFEACEALGRPANTQKLNTTYWAIIDEDPERAFALAGDNWLHLLNQYIVRDAYAGRIPPITEPFADAKTALEAGLVMLADGPEAIKTFNADVEKGTIDINLVTMMPGEPVDQVSSRLQYLNDRVLPHLNPATHPSAC